MTNALRQLFFGTPDEEVERLLQDAAIAHRSKDPPEACQDESSRTSRGSNNMSLRSAGKAIIVLAGLCAVAVAGKAFAPSAVTPNFHALVSGHSIIGAASALASASDLDQCADTPQWANGYYQCETDGYKGVGCGPRGFTCAAYAANRWCLDGKPVPSKERWILGEGLNYPEMNCCVCGGGSRSVQN